MKSNEINRRRFIGTVATASAGVATLGFMPIFGCKSNKGVKENPVDTTVDKDLVIGIWVPPPPHLLTTENDIKQRYKQIADAGINFIWGNSWFHIPEMYEKMQVILNACAEFGLTIMPALQIDTKSSAFSESELSRCLDLVNQNKNHPAVCGFNMIDEPSANIFDRLAVLRREIDAVLPDGKYTIANLFPNYASSDQLGSPDYETHVDDYMRKIQPKVLSFDHYPLVDTGDPEARNSRDRLFVANLITIRNASTKYHVPFWGFIQSIGWSGMREPTLDEYRWLCNAHIAFGAKGFSYFLYSAIGDTGGREGFTNSMLDWNGNVTYLYDYAKNINKELSGFANIVMPFLQDGFMLVNQNEQMTSTIPASLRRTSYGNLRTIETTGEMMNGCFDLNGQKAVYLLNWSKDASMTARLVFDKNVNFRLWSKEQLEKEDTATTLDVSFIPGEAKFLIFNAMK